MGKAKRSRSSSGRKRRSTTANNVRSDSKNRSLDILLAAVRSDPDNVRAALDLAEHYLSHNGGAKVSEVIRSIERLYPFGDGELRGAYNRLLAFGELHCGRLIEAEQAVERGLAEFPDSLDFHFARCHLKVALGEFDEAIVAAEAFLSLRDAMKSSKTAVKFSSTGAHPGRLLDLLGTAYRESGKIREAEDAYKRAIKAEPKNHLPYLNLAHLYFRTERKVEAAEVVEKGLEHCSQVQELRMLRDSFRRRSSVSACMIVKNEEESLGRCLNSIRDWVDEIVVVDTGSTDGTVDIALSYGARVLHQPWEGNFSKHRNYSIDQASGDWVFIIDADEKVCEEDVPELRRLLDGDKFDVISINVVNVYGANESRMVFLPSPRFFRRELGLRYEGIVHNQLIVPENTRACRAGFRIKHYGYDLAPEKMALKRTRSRELLEKQLGANPDDPYASFNLAQLLRADENGFAVEDAGEIIQYARRAVELTDPGNPRERHIHLMSLDLLGWANLHTGETEKAFEYCRRALELKENYLDSLLLLAHVHLQRQAFDEAEQQYRRYLEVQKNYKPALETDNLILMHVDSRVAAYYSLGLIAFNRGERQESKEWLKKTIEIDAGYLDANGVLGRLYLEEQDFETAEKHLERQLESGMNAARAAQALAAVYERTGRQELAEDCIDRMVRLAPDDGAALLSAAKYYFTISDPIRGRELLGETALLAQKEPSLWTTIADVSQQVGDHEGAAKAYEKALAESPDNPAILNDLANCHYRMGNFEEAERRYKQSISFESAPSVAYRNLGLALAQLGKVREAIARLEQYLAIEPEAHEILQVIGGLHVREREFSEAVGCYEKFLLVHPGDASALFSLSECYLNMGHTDSARMGYQRVLQLDPDFSPALQRMAEVAETV